MEQDSFQNFTSFIWVLISISVLIYFSQIDIQWPEGPLIYLWWPLLNLYTIIRWWQISEWLLHTNCKISSNVFIYKYIYIQKYLHIYFYIYILSSHFSHFLLWHLLGQYMALNAIWWLATASSFMLSFEHN